MQLLWSREVQQEKPPLAGAPQPRPRPPADEDRRLQTARTREEKVNELLDSMMEMIEKIRDEMHND